MKRILAAAAAAAVLTLVVPQPATAAVDSVGWFTRNPTASAPEGGLQVANAPDGVVSFGAISAAEDGEDISKATVTLKESGQAVNASGAKIRACPAAGSFKSGKGTLAEGPKADCTVGSVELTRDPSGSWTGEVTSLLAGAETPAIAVVPGEGAGLFQVSFAPPELAVEAESSGSGLDSSFDASEFGGSSGSSSGGSFSSDEFNSSGSSGSTFDSGSSSGSFDSSGSTLSSSFDAPTTVAPSVTPAAGTAVTTAAPAPEVAGETALPSRRRLSAEAASAAAPGDAGKKFVLFVIAAAIIGAGAGFGRNRLVTAKTA